LSNAKLCGTKTLEPRWPVKVKRQKDLLLTQDLQAFLRDLRAFAVKKSSHCAKELFLTD
jgi:hypothetical protein